MKRIEIGGLRCDDLYCIDKDNKIVEALSFSSIVREINDNIDLVLYPYVMRFDLGQNKNWVRLTLPRINDDNYTDFGNIHTNMIPIYDEFNESFLEYLFKYDKFLIKFNRDSIFTFIEEEESCIDHEKDHIICWEQVNGGTPKWSSITYNTPKESFLLIEGVSVPDYVREDYVKGFRYFTYENYKFVDLKSDIEAKRNKLLEEIEKLDLRYGLAFNF